MDSKGCETPRGEAAARLEQFGGLNMTTYVDKPRCNQNTSAEMFASKENSRVHPDPRHLLCKDGKDCTHTRGN